VRDPAQQAWVDGHCTPQPFGTIFERLRLSGPPAGRVARKLYILCTDPPLPYLRRFYDLAMASEGWQTMELATGHDAMVTAPGALTQILSDRAAARSNAAEGTMTDGSRGRG
jgi:hypothetical protein